MIERLLELPSHARERLASALETGILPLTPTAAALRSVLGNADATVAVSPTLAEFARLGVSAPAAAAWLRSLAKVEACAPRTDLVWSGPEVAGLHSRDTRRVYDELLGTAQRSVLISTYAFFDGPRAFATLAQRMEKVKNLRVTLLLNIQRRRGDETDADHLVRRFADRFWSSEWPGTARPAVFYDPRALDPGHPSGVLHAKVVVADDEVVLVTSANLTEAAFDRNIELGLLSRDRALASSISVHFRGLIDRGHLIKLPRD